MLDNWYQLSISKHHYQIFAYNAPFKSIILVGIGRYLTLDRHKYEQIVRNWIKYLGS